MFNKYNKNCIHALYPLITFELKFALFAFLQVASACASTLILNFS